MENQIKWDFVSTGGGDADGLNNSMIEYFTGDYNYFLAREIIQNSLDAKDKKINVSYPKRLSCLHNKMIPKERICTTNSWFAKNFCITAHCLLPYCRVALKPA